MPTVKVAGGGGSRIGLQSRCKIRYVSKFTAASRGFPCHSTAFLYFIDKILMMTMMMIMTSDSLLYVTESGVEAKMRRCMLPMFLIVAAEVFITAVDSKAVDSKCLSISCQQR